MPLYDYACDTCGPFRDWHPMSKAASPAACPECAGMAPRQVTAPSVFRMNPNTRVAHQRNEKSANEPQVVKKKAHDHGGHAHPHRHGGGSHGHGRPWMIGH